jgi:D-alanyl-D-alanine carboxypeptidase
MSDSRKARWRAAICSEKLQSKLVSLATKEAETMATIIITEEEILQGTAVVAASASEEDHNQGSGLVSTSSNSLPELLIKLKALSQNSQP